MRPAIRPVPFVGHVLVVPFTETGRRNRSARFIPANDILKLWTDTTTPRTERPVRFYPKGRPAPYPGPTDVCVEQAYGTSFRVSDAIRVF